jgi:hypothetical protein
VAAVRVGAAELDRLGIRDCDETLGWAREYGEWGQWAITGWHAIVRAVIDGQPLLDEPGRTFGVRALRWTSTTSPPPKSPARPSTTPAWSIRGP